VDDADGLADDGDVVEPAARGDARGRQTQDAVGERVAAAEVIEEPAVEVRLAQRSLNLGDTFDLLVAGADVLRDGARAEAEDEDERREYVVCSSHGVLNNSSSEVSLLLLVELAERAL
jgi:hypothetical protein